jgi:anaerobic ribonucleoside-triphosphate reductase
MKLLETYLCVNCDEVFDPREKGFACPSCGSHILAPLSRWIPVMPALEDAAEAARKVA